MLTERKRPKVERGDEGRWIREIIDHVFAREEVGRREEERL